MRTLICVLAVLAATSPASAQDLAFDPDLTGKCVAESDSPVTARTCIGKSANACMDDSEGGYSTVGMGGCLAAELDWWDARLNAVYGNVRADAKQADAANGAGSDGVPSQATSLRDMQRAWITYRDATCDYERSLWGGGTGGGPASLSCLLSMTAEQTIYLETAGPGL